MGSSRGTTVNHPRVHTNLRGFCEAPGLRAEDKSRTCGAERARKASEESCMRRLCGEREKRPSRAFLLSEVDARGWNTGLLSRDGGKNPLGRSLSLGWGRFVIFIECSRVSDTL